jgi:hypothetical protein
MHRENARLVAARLRVRRGSTHHLGPIRSQTLDVLGVLIIVRKRMIELGIGETSCVMGSRKSEKCSVAARELVQGWWHLGSLAHPRDLGWRQAQTCCRCEFRCFALIPHADDRAGHCRVRQHESDCPLRGRSSVAA